MKVINIIVYFILFIYLLLCILTRKRRIEALPSIVVYLRQHTILFIGLLIVNSISFVIGFLNEDHSFYIQKNTYGGEELQVPISLETEATKEEITLTVRPKKLEEKEVVEKMTEAFLVLEDSLKGENESLEHVTYNLNISLDYEKYPFDVECVPDDYSLISSDGIVKNKGQELKQLGYKEAEIAKGIPTRVRIVLCYEEICEEKEFLLRIYEEERSEREQLILRIREELESIEEESLYKEGFYLPSVIEGVLIKPHKQKGITAANSFLVGMILLILIAIKEKEDKRQEEIKRKHNLIRSYPWFVNEMTLLLGAGLQSKKIFYMMIKEYEMEKKDYREPFIQEIKRACKNLEIGMSEEQVYYQLGRNLGLPCYVKIMTLLEQNVKKGSKGLAAAFEKEEIDALEERKNQAKRLGEEAGTKLLGPMMLLLVVVMMMIMVPAFLSFS